MPLKKFILIYKRLQPRKWPGLNLKSPGIKNRSFASKLPAPLQAMASTVRLHDPPSASSDSNPIELPETPPHGGSYTSDHSVFAPVLLGGGLNTPGSPGPSLSMSSLSLGSPGNSPQLMSPGLHQSAPIPFTFNSGSLPSSSIVGSPGSLSLTQTPPSPSHLLQFGQPPPPLPPRTNRRREIGSNLQQARQAPNAPLLPPREGVSPPPLPPRRDLPRIPVTLNSNSSELLARRNSTLDNSCIISSTLSRRHMSFNGPSPTKPPSKSPNGGK